MTVCSAANGRPYEGQHTLVENARGGSFVVIEPDGTLRQFCDSDCLRQFYAWQFEQFERWYHAQRRVEGQA
jgi:hypothetical protein